MPISPARLRAGAVLLATGGVTASLLTAPAALAAPSDVSLTPSLVSFADWHQWVPSTYDYELTTKGGVPALRFSNANGPYGNITQLSTPEIAEVGEPVTGADYRVFTAEFTIDAYTYDAQPGLAIEVSADQSGNRSGGNLVFRQDADDELTLSTYWADAGSEADLEDWNNDTATVAFTGPLDIRYVVEYNPAAPDSVKVYVNDVLTIQGEGFEAYHVAAGSAPQVVDSLLFRTNTRTPVEDGAWDDATPTAPQQAALLGHGFYFSGIEYGASNEAIAPSSAVVVHPYIDGTAVVNGTLSARVETNVINPTITKYQWLREGLTISGATGSTYTLTANDVNKRISLKVTATKSGYTAGTGTSAKTAPVTAAALSWSASPSITGTLKLGSTLTANATTSPAATYAYQWYRNGAAIKGATAKTYKLAASDVGREMTVKVTATKAGYASLVAISDGTDTIEPGTLRPATVAVSGTYKVGNRLFATQKGFPSSVTVKYAWYADGELIQYSTSRGLTLTWQEKGKKISVIAIGAKLGYESLETPESAARGPVK